MASLSQLLLDRGAVACTLNTDVANATSNGVYQEIGYRPVAEHADDQPEQQAVVPIVEFSQRMLVATRDSLQERDVGKTLVRVRRPHGSGC